MKKQNKKIKKETKASLPPFTIHVEQRLAPSDIESAESKEDFKIGDIVYSVKTGTKKLKILGSTRSFHYSKLYKVTPDTNLANSEVEIIEIPEDALFSEKNKEKMLFALAQDQEEVILKIGEGFLKLNDKVEQQNKQHVIFSALIATFLVLIAVLSYSA
jgi:hypothetical protein